MLPRDEQKPIEGSFQPSILNSVGMVGFLSYHSWVFLSFYGLLFVNITGVFIEDAACRATTIIVVAITLYVSSLLTDKFNVSKTLVAAIVLSFAMPTMLLATAFGIDIVFALRLIIWMLHGIALAFAMLGWGHLFSRFALKKIEGTTAGAMLASACFYVGISAMNIPINIIIFSCLLPFSLCALLFCLNNTPRISFANLQVSKMRLKLSGIAHFANTVNCVSTGYVSCILFSYLLIQPLVYILIIGVAVVLAGTLIFYLKKAHPPLLYPGTFSRIVFPLVVVGFIVSPYFIQDHNLPSLIVIALTFMVLTAYDTSNWNALAALSNRYLVSPTYLFGHGRIPMALGQVLGWVLAAVALLPQIPSEYRLILSIVLTFVMAIVIVTQPRLPEKSYALSDDELEESTLQLLTEGNSGRWKQGCENLADQSHLTSREREIFMLLAKGRNANYAKDNLFISHHTVKTHIYHIYKKLNVASHQELLDEIERSVQSVNENDTQGIK